MNNDKETNNETVKTKKKIKNSVKAFSPDLAIFIMCFGILVACPIRILQMLKNMDSVTGFYLDSGNVTIMILYGVLAVASLCILIFTYLSSRVPADIAPKGRRIPLGIASLFFAGTLLYSVISGYIPDSEKTETLVQNAKTVSLLSHFQLIFAFLAFCYFVILFFSYILGNTLYKKFRILALAPLIWIVVRTLERLTIIISFVRVSELLLELCALVFLMIFFLGFARVMSEINSEGTMWSVIACGAVSSLLILTYTIPRIMLLITGNGESIVNGYPINYSDIGCVLFILVFIITTLRCGYKREDIKAMNEETQAIEASEVIDEPEEETPEISLSINKDSDVSISKSISDDNSGDAAADE